MIFPLTDTNNRLPVNAMYTMQGWYLSTLKWPFRWVHVLTLFRLWPMSRMNPLSQPPVTRDRPRALRSHTPRNLAELITLTHNYPSAGSLLFIFSLVRSQKETLYPGCTWLSQLRPLSNYLPTPNAGIILLIVSLRFCIFVIFMEGKYYTRINLDVVSLVIRSFIFNSTTGSMI